MRTGCTSSTGQTGPKADKCPRISVGFEGEGEGENGCRWRSEWKLVGLSSLLIDTYLGLLDQLTICTCCHLDYHIGQTTHEPLLEARLFAASISHCPQRSWQRNHPQVSSGVLSGSRLSPSSLEATAPAYTLDPAPAPPVCAVPVHRTLFLAAHAPPSRIRPRLLSKKRRSRKSDLPVPGLTREQT